MAAGQGRAEALHGSVRFSAQDVHSSSVKSGTLYLGESVSFFKRRSKENRVRPSCLAAKLLL